MESENEAQKRQANIKTNPINQDLHSLILHLSVGTLIVRPLAADGQTH
jgi:hypothetical protein